MKKFLKQNYALLIVLSITIVLTVLSKINTALALVNIFFVMLQIFLWWKSSLYRNIYINFFIILFAVFVSLIFIGYGFGSEENAFNFLIPCFFFLLFQSIIWIWVSMGFLRNLYTSKIK